MKYEDLILDASKIVQEELQKLIIHIDLDLDAGRLKTILNNRIIIYIRYNNYNEYSYVVQFSLKQGDRVQFDNFDDTWDVNTRPHHCHPRFKREAIESEFNGNPKHDMPILCNMVKRKDIFKFE